MHSVASQLTARQILARLRAIDGEGSGLAADLVLARPAATSGRLFNVLPLAGAGIAAPAHNPDAVQARAALGA